VAYFCEDQPKGLIYRLAERPLRRSWCPAPYPLRRIRCGARRDRTRPPCGPCVLAGACASTTS